jgi:nitroimidazol reductase NimA-like FMN-containing flavoprotein (pyridoxamine 5'-phosphate oxidase superfamily)
MKTIIHTDREKMEAVINASEICFVGMADTEGVPYVLPMNFSYFGGAVYLHSAQEGRKIDILKRNPNVCITFCSTGKLTCQHPDVACSYSMHAISVLAWGRVTFEEDFEEKTNMLNLFMKHYSGKTFHYGAPAVRNVKMWKVIVETMTCKETGVSAESYSFPGHKHRSAGKDEPEA